MLLGADFAPVLQQVVHLGHVERRVVDAAVHQAVFFARDQLLVGDHLQRQRGAEVAVGGFDVGELAVLEDTDGLAHLRRHAGLQVIAGQGAEQLVGEVLELGLDLFLVVEVREDGRFGGLVDDVSRHRGQFRAVPRFAFDDFLEQLALPVQAVLLEGVRKIPAGARGCAKALDLVEKGPHDGRFGVDLHPIVENRVGIASVIFNSINQIGNGNAHFLLLITCG